MATVKEVVQAFLGLGKPAQSTRSESLHSAVGKAGVYVLHNNKMVLAVRVGNKILEKVHRDPHNASKLNALLYAVGTVPGDENKAVSRSYAQLDGDMSPSEMLSWGPEWWREAAEPVPVSPQIAAAAAEDLPF